MANRFRKPSLLLILTISLLILLPVLAGLQFHWLGQVSVAEHERMQSNLKTSVAQFAQDFDSQLTQIYLHFPIDMKSVESRSWNGFSGRYEHWTGTTFPNLVSEIYLVNHDDVGGTIFSVWNGVDHEFVRSEWPADASALRAKVEQYLLKPASEGGTRFGDVNPISDSPLAVIIPIPDQGSTVDAKSQLNPGIYGVTVVRLNEAYIKQSFIPALIKNHFSASDELDYNIAIVSQPESMQKTWTMTKGDKQSARIAFKDIIYQSGSPISSEMLSSGDASVNLLNIQLGNSGNDPAVTRTRPMDQTKNGSEGGKKTFNFGIASDGPSNRTIFASRSANASGAGSWKLVLKHRAGSLEAAVAYLRYRNLAISFGIMLLLAGSLTLILVSTRRAQLLARQQIEFVAGVSHELRTPLAVICSAGENLADGIVIDAERSRYYGKVIRDEGRRLTEMVEDILQLTGTTSERKWQTLSPINLEMLIREVIATNKSGLDERGFTLDLDIQSQLAEIMAEPAALKRSLQNLIDNSLKYCALNKWIGISARNLKISGQEKVQVSVRDNGVGIEMADLPHVFEPFYRGKNVVEAQIHGNGLGLSIVKKTIESFGGNVFADCKPGDGTRIVLRFPALPAVTCPDAEVVESNYERADSAG